MKRSKISVFTLIRQATSPRYWFNWLLIVLIGLLAGPYLYQRVIEFRLPMATDDLTANLYIRLQVVLVLCLLLLGIYWGSKKIPAKWLTYVLGLLLLPCCFIATSPISGIDYAYIFFPALKIIRGTSVFDIYFQYDLLLSFIATVWIKLGLALGELQTLGQISYALVFFTIFLASQRLFQRKLLPFILLITLVLIRIYANPWDSVVHLQATSLRLDLWLILFASIWFKGPFHVLTGVICGLLIFFHRNFGLIHTVAYVQLILLLGVTQYSQSHKLFSLKKFVFKFLRQIYPNLTIILFFYLAFVVLFGNENANATSYYQRIGIGFLPIDAKSFFWYYMPIFPIAFALLYQMQHKIEEKNLMMGFFVLFCTLGNSVYYFGRSHDGNLFSISISLVFLLFYVFDLVDRLLLQPDAPASAIISLKKAFIPIVATVIMLTVAFTYADRIKDKFSKQLNTISTGRIHHQDPFAAGQADVVSILDIVKTLTHDSSDVQIFMENSEKEFLLYFYGNYKPKGYFHPFTSWIFMDELMKHLQHAVDQGDYVLIQTNVYHDLFAKRLINVGWVYALDQNLTLIAKTNNR